MGDRAARVKSRRSKKSVAAGGDHDQLGACANDDPTATTPSPLKCICPKCSKEALDEDKAVSCDICRNWFHIDCVNLDEQTYLYISTHKCLGWFCYGCENAKDLYTDMVIVCKQSNELKAQLQALTNTVGDLSTTITTQSAEQAKVNDDLGEKIKAIEEKVDSVSETTAVDEDSIAKKAMRLAISEVKLQQTREKNMMVYGIEESTSQEAKERQKHDTEKVNKILKESKISASFIKPVRVGDPTKCTGPRPLKITAASDQALANLKKAGRTLKDINTGNLKNVFIKPDRTPFQRDEMRYLVRQCQEKQRASEEAGTPANWQIRYGKVVNIIDKESGEGD